MAKYLAAVSGGPDSMVMLHIYRKQIEVVCHVNYLKRPSANRDMEIVQSFCKTHKLPLEILKVESSIYQQYYKINHNFQTMARNIRYDFFVKCARKYKVDTVMIAHNKDDFLETVYMQKKRQTKNLFMGIAKISKYKNIYIYRPFLNKWKKELLQYCEKNNIAYGIDETNELDVYERNRVRKVLIKLSDAEKETEIKRIEKINKLQSSKIKMIQKQYVLWEHKNFDLDIFCDAPL
jgi:tRNA(Ile)-lysidine synthase